MQTWSSLKVVDQAMIDIADPLTLASAACVLFGVTLCVRPMTLPFVRAALRIAAFAILTAALLHAGIAPNRPVPAWTSVVRHTVGQLLVGFWWLGGAAVVNSVVRAALRIRDRPTHERFLQDIVATVAYILAILQISDKVFGLPVGALLATSGAIAIVVGLALQSTLGDAFSGLLLNLTHPYSIGDWIVVDATLEGQVIETNWRATHLMTAERNIAIVPNSVLAKTRFINTSTSLPARGVTVHLQLRPDVRPRTVTTALGYAATGHMEILGTPSPQIAIRSTTVEFVDYEVRFFIARKANEAQVTAQFLDMTYQHLTAFGVSRTPAGATAAEADIRSFDERLIADAEPLSSLAADVRTKLALQATHDKLAAGESLPDDGAAPGGMLFVSAGVLSVYVKEQGATREIARLQPGDHWVTLADRSGRHPSCFIKALTASRFVLIPGDAIAPFDEDIADSLATL
jgi:small-conductance mechanosensitive channel